MPFAVLVGCSDSRVPPELLFDTGLGELFIVRNAGNTIDTVAMAAFNTRCRCSTYRLSWLKAKAMGPKAADELLDGAVRENVRRTVDRLRTAEPSMIEPIKAGKLVVVGAHYGLDDGKLDFFIES